MINDMTVGKVVLKTKNHKKLAAFYHEIIGLKILAQESAKTILGVGNSELLELLEVADGVIPKQAKTGLYHTAFLLPTRAELGSFLQHLLESEYPLDGAGDHIFSEALYFRDPEGNGIEVYADRPIDEWERDENGNLPMATNPVDGDGLLMAGAELDWSSAPAGTTVGHIHLQITDLEATREFYHHLLGFAIKTEIPSALFFASGDYHHHIGSNIWAGRNLSPLEANETGLAYYTLITADLARVTQHLQEKAIPFEQQNGAILLTDPNGIAVQITN